MQNTRNRQSAVIALGMFDGVHMGHRAILRKTVDLARERDALPVAVSFGAHPQTLFGKSTPLLTLPDEREAIFRSLGLIPLLLDFDRAMAQLSPEDFIRYLYQYYEVSGMVVGFNNRFGHKAAGDIHTLKKLGAAMGFTVDVIEAINWQGETVSSSRIRKALETGAIQDANIMLEQPFFYRGIVEKHRQIGRTIGFPTLNIRPGEKLVPRRGVYAARVKRGLKFPSAGELLWDSVTHIGNNPTVTDKKDIYIESHVLEALPEMYGEPIFVTLLSFIRPQVRFSSLEEMKEQIAKDRVESLRILQNLDGKGM